MAAFLFLVQLLFIGTLIAPAYTEKCDLLVNTTESNFTLTVTPMAYRENTTYLVAINDNRNLTDNKNLTGRNVTDYLLQAVSLQNVSLGKWDVEKSENCSSIDTAVLNGTQKEANWTSPESNITSVEIRAFIILSDNSIQLTTVTLHKEMETTTAPPTTAPPNTTPNSVSMLQSSSFFVAVMQLPLILVTSKLLS